MGRELIIRNFNLTILCLFNHASVKNCLLIKFLLEENIGNEFATFG